MTQPQPIASTKIRAVLAAGLLLTAAGLIGCGPGASAQRRSDYLSAHPEMSADTRTLIENGRVGPGMTKDQVLAAWGSPPSDCKSWQSNLQTIWDYCHHPGRTLVIFDRNGRVSTVQQQ
jgi:hypothetical protein